MLWFRTTLSFDKSSSIDPLVCDRDIGLWKLRRETSARPPIFRTPIRSTRRSYDIRPRKLFLDFYLRTLQHELPFSSDTQDSLLLHGGLRDVYQQRHSTLPRLLHSYCLVNVLEDLLSPNAYRRITASLT